MNVRFSLWASAALAILACSSPTAIPTLPPTPTLAPTAVPIPTNAPQNLSREVIGKWQDAAPPSFGGTITIYRSSGILTMERKFPDGSGITRELVEKTVSGQRRLEEKGRSALGEYYVIDTRGGLELYDRDGLIRVARAAQ